MTPKDKAVELLNKFRESIYNSNMYSGQEVTVMECALICVDEILNSQPTKPCEEGDLYDNMVSAESYWKQVKKELEKL